MACHRSHNYSYYLDSNCHILYRSFQLEEDSNPEAWERTPIDKVADTAADRVVGMVAA